MRVVLMTAATANTPGGSTEPPTPTGAETDEQVLEDDLVFHLLQTRRRRLVLRYLHAREGPAEMRDVAEQVAAWENDTTVGALRSDERKRVYVPLYQTHLPKLDDADVIEYEKSRGVVRRGERFEELCARLDFDDAGGSDAETDPGTGDEPAAERAGGKSSTYYGGATLLSTGLITGVWTGLLALPGIAVATMVTALFSLVTLGVGMRG